MPATRKTASYPGTGYDTRAMNFTTTSVHSWAKAMNSKRRYRNKCNAQVGSTFKGHVSLKDLKADYAVLCPHATWLHIQQLEYTPAKVLVTHATFGC